MVKGINNIKRKKKTYKNLIERDVELLQGAYFGGKPEHILEKNKKKKAKKKKITIKNLYFIKLFFPF
jgi:hypothetical protein